jgi:hypothetical protein
MTLRWKSEHKKSDHEKGIAGNGRAKGVRGRVIGPT